MKRKLIVLIIASGVLATGIVYAATSANTKEPEQCKAKACCNKTQPRK